MKTNRKLVLALGGVLAALAAASIGWAAIPETNGTIHGCYKKDSGALRVYDATTNAPKACTDKESPLDWQQGGASKAYWNPSSVMSWLDATSWPGSQVASSSVPAGSYMFMANTILKPFGLNSAQHLVQCRLNAHDNLTGKDYWSNGRGFVASNGVGETQVTPLTMSVGWTFGAQGGTITLSCITPVPSQAESTHLWALQVGELHL